MSIPCEKHWDHQVVPHCPGCAVATAANPGKHRCQSCGEVQDIEENFRRRSGGRRIGKLRPSCLKCATLQGRRRWNKALYGVTPEHRDAMWASQGERCAICKGSETAGRGGFHIDHCHSSGTVRGILCNHCNMMLGHSKDNSWVLAAAIEYLRQANPLLPGLAAFGALASAPSALPARASDLPGSSLDQAC